MPNAKKKPKKAQGPAVAPNDKKWEVTAPTASGMGVQTAPKSRGSLLQSVPVCLRRFAMSSGLG